MWNIIPPTPISLTLPQSNSPEPSYIADTVTIKAPWIFSKTPCPVNKDNRDAWTAAERIKAENRVIAKDLDHLQALVSLPFPIYN